MGKKALAPALSWLFVLSLLVSSASAATAFQRDSEPTTYPAVTGDKNGLQILFNPETAGSITGNPPSPGLPDDSYEARSTSGPEPPAGVSIRGFHSPGDQAVVIPGVPAYIWRHGCAPTAAAMLLGYWDQNGYDWLIEGRAATQTGAVDQVIASDINPANHVTDYAEPYDAYPVLLIDKSGPPPEEVHPDDSLADFMKTSQSFYNNYYGWTWNNHVGSGMKGYFDLVAPPFYSASTSILSFNNGSLSWEAYQAEIDAGRPVLLLVDTDGDGATDHFVTAAGYDESEDGLFYGAYNTWNTGLHWYPFQPMAPGKPWGIHSATIFTISGLPPVEGRLSYSYAGTIGTTDQPYLTDLAHLYGPSGLLVGEDGSLYVTEELGHRLVKFSPDGEGLLSIGAAGQPWYHDQFLAFPRAAVESPNSTIWILISTALKEFDAAGNLLQIFPATDPWQGGDENDRFNEPRGLAFDSSGRLFVSDSGNHRVQVYTFDLEGRPVYSTTIGTTGEPQDDDNGFNLPGAIAFDSSSRLYVLDAANQRVQRCEEDATWNCTTFFGQTGTPGQDLEHLNGASGLATSPDDRVYLVDGGNYRVFECSQSGECTLFAGQTGEQGWGDDLFWKPVGIAVDGAHNVYVSDREQQRVKIYSSQGAYQGSIGVARTPYLTDGAHFNQSASLAAALDGSLYLGESAGFRLLKLDPQGNVLWSAGEAGVYGDDSDHFGDWWAGLEGKPALDAQGWVYIPDAGNHRIQIFSADGDYTQTFGEFGQAPGQFSAPAGTAISPLNGDIAVADRANQRIQVFSSDLIFKLAIGVTGEPGSDDQHLNNPHDVVFDASGNLYIADTGNRRVQKCDLSSASPLCQTFVGQTGIISRAFNHLEPVGLAIDPLGKLVAADGWNSRVQIFDLQGNFLTTLAGEWGSHTAGLRSPSSVAVDQEGRVFVSDRDSHHVRIFSPGYPGWIQTNLNGFGKPENGVTFLETFGGYLYTGTSGSPAELWRSPGGTTWERLNPPWQDGCQLVNDAVAFQNMLYLGLSCDTGAEIWRTNGELFEQVVSAGFDRPANLGANALGVFFGRLYAGISNLESGLEVWSSSSGNSGSWDLEAENGFGGGETSQDMVTGIFSSRLYLGFEQQGQARLYASNGDSSWSQVQIDGLSPTSSAVSALASFNGYLYAGLENTSGGEVWRTSDGTDWEQVVFSGLSNPGNLRPDGLISFQNMLYLVFSNPEAGAEVWRTLEGLVWEQVSGDGWGNALNRFAGKFNKSAAIFDQHLYTGSFNQISGGIVWKKTVTANFTAVNSRGLAPLDVQFTSTSGGDITTYYWVFGDGATSQEPNPAHTYTGPGIYDVTLIVSDSFELARLTRPGLVEAFSDLRAAFSAAPVGGLAPLSVSFTNLSTGQAPTFLWSFGDGSTSSEEQPSYTYSPAGIYTVSLTASDPTGSDTETKTGYIRVWPPGFLYLPVLLQNR